MSTSLITGATAGLGAAFARRLAAEHSDLVLVARNEQRLADAAERLQREYDVPVETIVADLSTEDGYALIERRLRESPVDLLVNNAGKGMAGAFADVPVEEAVSLTQLHVLAVMRLTHAAIGPMLERGRGDVINVSSTAGMFPGRAPVYGADKAWVTAFSESLAMRLAPRGVRVMALCPGFVRTEFHQRAGIRPVGPEWIWLDADVVVADGLHALRHGQVVAVTDLRYRVLVTLSRLVPRRVLRSMAARV